MRTGPNIIPDIGWIRADTLTLKQIGILTYLKFVNTGARSAKKIEILTDVLWSGVNSDTLIRQSSGIIKFHIAPNGNYEHKAAFTLVQKHTLIAIKFTITYEDGVSARKIKDSFYYHGYYRSKEMIREFHPNYIQGVEKEIKSLAVGKKRDG